MNDAAKTIVRFGVVLALASPGLVAFLKTWEDGPTTQHVVYSDPLTGTPTACGGLTPAASPEDVIVGDYWSADRCERVLRMVLEHGQIRLSQCFDVPITQDIFDAFSAFAHNVGVPAACASRAIGLINAGRTEEGCDAMAFKPDGTPVWSYVGKRYVRGLFKRRLAERQWCMKGLT